MLFECPMADVGTASLMGIEAVVAAPFFDDQNRVAGVVYGSRDRRTMGRRYEIKPLEALLVQLLAGIVGSGTVNLRRKIEPQEGPRYIKTDPRVGYRFAA